MSKKEKLQKALAVSLMLTNIFCTPVWAADPVDGTPGTEGTPITKNEDISAGISSADGTYKAGDGTPGTSGNNSGKGGDGANGGSVTVNDTVTGNIGGEIAITATGGNGSGPGWGYPYGNIGGGGSSKVIISVAGDGIITNNDISIAAKGGSAYDGTPTISNPDKHFDPSASGNGGTALAVGLQAEAKSTVASITAADLTISAMGGKGSSGMSNYDNGGIGGIGGAAEAYGLTAAASLLALDINDIKITATGGAGGSGGNGGVSGNIGNGGAGGAAGISKAWGINSTDSDLQGTANSILVQAQGGAGATGGETSCDRIVGASSEGAEAQAYGINNESSKIDVIFTNNISAEASGGAGSAGAVGASGSNSNSSSARKGKGADGGAGSKGGSAFAYGVRLNDSAGAVTVSALSSTAAGGIGGIGGNGGGPGNDETDGIAGKGGDGGNGGDAAAYAAYVDNSSIQLAVDTITAAAKAGSGAGHGSGATMTGGTSNGTDLVNTTPGADGADGSNGNAAAYGIYAINGSTLELKSAGSGTVAIAATAEDGSSNEAYAVYTADSKVILYDNVNITDGSIFLHNSILAFGDKTADRTLTSSGALQLVGSNTFMVNTDLTAGTADKFTFDSLAADSSKAKQYITIGYDAAIDPYKEGSIEAKDGQPIDVLAITGNLNGQDLSNFVGGTTTLDSVLYQFNTTPDVQLDGSGKIVQITGVKTTKTPAPSESIKTASDAQLAASNMWRIEGNNLMKRMGDLRSDSEAAEGGVWARYYRGEMSADSAYDRSFDQDYTAFQGGIDKVQDYKGGKLYTGIAVNRIDSNAGYNSGSGDMSSTGVGVYASWLGSKGHYLDVIARGSKLANDFKLVDLSGNTAKGDYDTWAYGISAEYGYRQDLQGGWFVEPQAELSLGHIQSAGYEMSNGARIENKGVDSAVTRLGILGGKEFTIGGRPSNAYLKASLLHDFGSNGGATAYYGTDSLVMQTGDLTGSWYEIGLGANLGLAKNSNLYFDALKTFGGDLRTDWQFNAGLRFTF